MVSPDEINIENMTRWIEALESGEYPQDPRGGALKTSDGYCCLGVLCELDGVHWVEHPVMSNQRRIFTTEDGLMGLPSSQRMRRFLGIEGQTVLAQGVGVMNDNGKTFAEIAQALRTEFNIPKA